MASTTTDKLQLIIAHYVRREYEAVFNKIHIPVALKYIIESFSRRAIASKIITMKEDLDFIQLISSKLSNIKKFKLLYRASENEYSAKRFHEACDNHGPTITIIKNQIGNVFGGYTKVKWQSTCYFDQLKYDDTAFLFVIRSRNDSQKVPNIFSITKPHQAIRHNGGAGPIFGAGPAVRIKDKCNINLSWSRIPEGDIKENRTAYNYHGHLLCGKEKELLWGNTQSYAVEDYEVFQLILK